MTSTALHRAVPALALLAGIGGAPAYAQHSEALKVGMEQQEIDTLVQHGFGTPRAQARQASNPRLHDSVETVGTARQSDHAARQSRLQCELQPGLLATAWKCRPQQ